MGVVKAELDDNESPPAFTFERGGVWPIWAGLDTSEKSYGRVGCEHSAHELGERLRFTDHFRSHHFPGPE